jgi:entericidin A
MKKITSPLVAMALLFAAGSLVTACHTVEGAGQDVQQAGQAVEQTAHEANDGNPATP